MLKYNFLYYFFFPLFFFGVKCQNYLLEIRGKLECGNQPATGTLDVYKGGSQQYIKNFKINRENFNIVQISNHLKTAPPAGQFKLIFRTGCGVISKLGSCCENAVEIPSKTFGKQTLFNAWFHPENANLLELIRKGYSKMLCSNKNDFVCK